MSESMVERSPFTVARFVIALMTVFAITAAAEGDGLAVGFGYVMAALGLCELSTMPLPKESKHDRDA